MACSPRSMAAFARSSRTREKMLSCPVSWNSRRMSTRSTTGSGRWLTRSFISIKAYFPVSALRQDSSDGVAEPRTTVAPLILARMTATSRAW